MNIGDVVTHKTNKGLALLVVDRKEPSPNTQITQPIVLVRWLAGDGKFYTQELFEYEVELKK